MTKEEIDEATGKLIIAIGNGTFRDAVAMLMDRVAREAYLYGTNSATKMAIEHRWGEFDLAFDRAVMDGNHGLAWQEVAMAAQRVRNLMQ